MDQNQDKLQQNLKKQLAVAAAVRSIQWSYSIFWSISPSQPRVLEWGEGYYNGDIKTRKTVKAVECDGDQMSLKRSEQLRELYQSLLAGETNPQFRRPSASLIPEDLSDSEWYYLVCMSFLFNLGQGLPGKALGSGKPIWLCNAHQVDSRGFTRSLLAKSASIQTVVCFPLLGGVVELGTTDLVLEDYSLIQYVEASLLGTDGYPALPQTPISVTPHHNLENARSPIAVGEELRLVESNSFGLDETSFMTEGVNGELADDELSNCVYTSNDCKYQSLVYPEDPVHVQDQDKVEDSCLMKMESDNYGQSSIDDLHYQNVLGRVFKTGHGPALEHSVSACNKKSDFVSWKRGDLGSYHNPRCGNSQRILKKILFEVPRIHGAERKRLETVSDGFCLLKSLIPSVDKVDEVSILDDTIKYMKELERRVKELEARQDLDECGLGRANMNPQDAGERTSHNQRNNKAGLKRKVNDINLEERMENSLASLRDNSTNTRFSISLIHKDVSIEITCPWKECLLLEIIDALANLRLDAHVVQSSISDSFLSVTIKAKIKGFERLSAGVIRQVLQRLLKKSG